MDDDHPALRQAVEAIGRGDFERSFRTVAEVAEQGDAVAQHFLGWHHHKGIGTPQDDERACAWWLKAARQGLPEAQQGLGWAYANGRGVVQDFVEAYRWYNRAVAGGDEEARQGLSEVAGRLSAAQLRALEQEPRG
ncbi:MAG: tetratricopeptide repeat protein [Gammaproteobacteria bacterium]|jgi:TPR repeat protein